MPCDRKIGRPKFPRSGSCRFCRFPLARILGEIGGEVRDLPPKRFQAWTEGFAQAVDGIKGAWPKGALSRDDKQVLNLIRSAAIEDLAPTLKPLLPSWLQMTAVKWREDL